MLIVNAADCEPDEAIERGAFRAQAFDLTERALEPGELVAFCSGPAGAHSVQGPGRVMIFSAGARGWGEAFVSVYPDSDKIAAAPGVMFRRADAIGSWRPHPGDHRAEFAPHSPSSRPSSTAVNLITVPLPAQPAAGTNDQAAVRRATLGPRLGAQTWAATLFELASGDATAGYHYQWCRETWALVVSGRPTLRHSDGESVLSAGDVCCFPQGPSGARQLRNDGVEPARLIEFSTATDRPMSTFHPDEGTVLIQFSAREGLLFRHRDHIDDYWDGEPGAT